MRTLCAVVLGAVAVGAGGFAAADDAKDDFAKKIVGKWEITKAGGDVGPGSTLEFAKDGKFVMVVKDGDKTNTLKGSYKIAKDKLTVTLKTDDTAFDQTLTIKKLTDDDMELLDENNMTDVLKRKREA